MGLVYGLGSVTFVVVVVIVIEIMVLLQLGVSIATTTTAALTTTTRDRPRTVTYQRTILNQADKLGVADSREGDVAMRLVERYLTAMLAIVGLASHVSGGAVFESDWDELPDRIWLGPEYWANPMEDWRIRDGRLECRTGGANRNVHLLVCELAGTAGAFAMSVSCGRLDAASTAGSVGFRIGIRDEIDDYRARCLRGQGLDVGVDHRGRLFIGSTFSARVLAVQQLQDVVLRVAGRSHGTLTLEARDPETGDILASIGTQVGLLAGNIALVNNHTQGKARYWFKEWKLSGDSVLRDDERAWGPILWSIAHAPQYRAGARHEDDGADASHGLRGSPGSDAADPSRWRLADQGSERNRCPLPYRYLPDRAVACPSRCPLSPGLRGEFLRGEGAQRSPGSVSGCGRRIHWQPGQRLSQ